jgi:hypothetical protein
MRRDCDADRRTTSGTIRPLTPHSHTSHTRHTSHAAAARRRRGLIVLATSGGLLVSRVEEERLHDLDHNQNDDHPLQSMRITLLQLCSQHLYQLIGVVESFVDALHSAANL